MLSVACYETKLLMVTILFIIVTIILCSWRIQSERRSVSICIYTIDHALLKTFRGCGHLLRFFLPNYWSSSFCHSIFPFHLFRSLTLSFLLSPFFLFKILFQRLPHFCHLPSTDSMDVSNDQDIQYVHHFPSETWATLSRLRARTYIRTIMGRSTFGPTTSKVLASPNWAIRNDTLLRLWSPWAGRVMITAYAWWP